MADGSAWKKSGWNHVFDHSPTYTFGAQDSSQANWGFVDPAYPMAAHPDQLWIDGVAMQQVASRAAVKAGTFFYDESGKNLYVGTNPVGHTAVASTLAKAMSVRVSGVTVRGIGIRRFAPSVPHMGAVTLEKPNIVFENVAVLENATQGISAISSGITLRKVTSSRNGLMGIHANYADNLKLLAVRSTLNNAEHFNMAPSAGGFKVTKTRGVTGPGQRLLRQPRRGDVGGHVGLRRVITGSSFNRNAHHGVFLEISLDRTRGRQHVPSGTPVTA